MIERFRLPHATPSMKSLVDPMRRSSLNGIHDPGQRADFHGLIIDARSKNQVHVIRHNDRDLQVIVPSVVVQAGFEDDCSDMRRNDPTPVRAERNKVRLLVDLQVRQLPSIESLRHRGYVGTAAPGCPRSAASQHFDSSVAEVLRGHRLSLFVRSRPILAPTYGPCGDSRPRLSGGRSPQGFCLDLMRTLELDLR